MQGLFTTSILAAAVAAVFASFDSAELSARDVDRQEAYVAAAYAAEAATQKGLAAAKVPDVDAAARVAELAAGPAGADAAYGTANAGADAGYFDLRFSTAPSEALDLGEAPGGDVVVRATRPADRFDAIALDYRSEEGVSGAQVTVTRSARSADRRCGFQDSAEGTCPSYAKFVVNTSDASRNGVPDRGFSATYAPGTVTVFGFDPDAWDYRVSFATLDGKPARWSYRASLDGKERPVANNVVELDAAGTAVDQYARVKVRKRVADELQPASRFVLLSDGEIAK